MGIQDTKEKGRTKLRRGIIIIISKQAMVYFMLYCRIKIWLGSDSALFVKGPGDPGASEAKAGWGPEFRLKQ